MVKKDLFNNKNNNPMAIIFKDWLEEFLRLMKNRRKDPKQKRKIIIVKGSGMMSSRERPEEKCVLLILNLIISFGSFIKTTKHLNNVKQNCDLDFLEIINKIHKIANSDPKIEKLVNKCMEAKEFIKKVKSLRNNNNNNNITQPVMSNRGDEAEGGTSNYDTIDLTDTKHQSSSASTHSFSSSSSSSYNKNNTGDPLVATAALSSNYLTSHGCNNNKSKPDYLIKIEEKQKRRKEKLIQLKKEEQQKKIELEAQKKIQEQDHQIEMLKREVQILTKQQGNNIISPPPVKSVEIRRNLLDTSISSLGSSSNIHFTPTFEPSNNNKNNNIITLSRSHQAQHSWNQNNVTLGRGRGRALTQPAWMTRTSVASQNKDKNSIIGPSSSSVSFRDNNQERPADFPSNGGGRESSPPNYLLQYPNHIGQLFEARKRTGIRFPKMRNREFLPRCKGHQDNTYDRANRSNLNGNFSGGRRNGWDNADRNGASNKSDWGNGWGNSNTKAPTSNKSDWGSSSFKNNDSSNNTGGSNGWGNSNTKAPSSNKIGWGNSSFKNNDSNNKAGVSKGWDNTNQNGASNKSDWGNSTSNNQNNDSSSNKTEGGSNSWSNRNTKAPSSSDWGNS